MRSYEFTIVATGLSIDNEDWADSFYEAGCDDAFVGIQRGVFVLHFDREAPSAVAAIKSACEDVRRAGAHVLRIEPDPLVSGSDIAERSGLTRQAVSLYVNGERGVGFPTPVACICSSRPLWDWMDVATWLCAAGRLDNADLELAHAISLANADCGTASAIVRPSLMAAEQDATPEPASEAAAFRGANLSEDRANRPSASRPWTKPERYQRQPTLRLVSAEALAARADRFKLRRDPLNAVSY